MKRYKSMDLKIFEVVPIPFFGGVVYLRSIFKVAMVYVGGVIGAGFASGQEIMQFFAKHGEIGILGAVLAGGLFIYLGILIMYLSVSLGARNYLVVLRSILGVKLAKLIDMLSLIMLPGGFAVMLAGSGAVFSEHLGFPQHWGVLSTALFSCVVLFKGIKGFVGANVILVPVKICAITLLCLAALLIKPLDNGAGHVINTREAGFVWDAILYVSYNMIVPVAVMSSLGKNVSLKEGVLGAAAGGAVLALCILLVTVSEINFFPGITGYEIPILYMASFLPGVFKGFMVALIWIAILTTAVADAHGFAARLSVPGSKSYRLTIVGLAIIILPLASLKFSFLVKILYPMFGYCGLVLLAGLSIMPVVGLIRRNINIKVK